MFWEEYPYFKPRTVVAGYEELFYLADLYLFINKSTGKDRFYYKQDNYILPRLGHLSEKGTLLMLILEQHGKTELSLVNHDRWPL